MAIVCPERDSIESIVYSLRKSEGQVRLAKIWPNELPSNSWRFLLQDVSNCPPGEITLLGISEPRDKIHYPERVAVFGQYNGAKQDKRPAIWRDDIETCGMAVLVRRATEQERQKTNLRVAMIHLEPQSRHRDSVVFRPTDLIIFYNPVL